MPTPAILRLDPAAATARLDELADILVDCVAGGASVTFLPPFGRDDARAFFRDAIGDVARGGRVLLAVEDATSRLAGSVQMIFAAQPNQRHRAEIAKLLVHRRARRLGFGRALMVAIEDAAREAGRTLLTLDTEAGRAGEALYRALGWTLAGTIPRYARSTGGGLHGTAIFWKEIAAPGVAAAPARS